MSVEFGWIIPVILSVISAATPLLLAATGELVTEKSGVLNLGIEGMMLVGAVTGFAVTLSTGNAGLGILAAALAGAPHAERVNGRPGGAAVLRARLAAAVLGSGRAVAGGIAASGRTVAGSTGGGPS